MFGDLARLIPNLQLGYLYDFGDRVGAGRLSLDYFLSVRIGSAAAFFGEAHGEFQNFWKTLTGTYDEAQLGAFNNRTDLSFGGGVRRVFGGHTLFGVNGFYDTTRLGGAWYGAGSLGFEMIALTPGNDAVDINFNYYGGFPTGRTDLLNLFRHGPANYDLDVGYSHELFDEGPDLRLKAGGYQFDIGRRLHGYKAGADLTTRDGRFSLKYQYARDPVDGAYHTIGGFVNVGLQLERLFAGLSPFTAPEPVFKSPRNLNRMLTRNAQRDWRQAMAVVGARPIAKAGGTAAPLPPYFIITFRAWHGKIVSQTNGVTASTLTVRPGSPLCVHHFYGDGYDITVAGDRPPGNITVTVTWSGLFNGDPPGGCRFVSDACRPLLVYDQVILAGTSTITVPRDCGAMGVPTVSRAIPCWNCVSSVTQTGLAGTVTFTAAGVQPQTVTFYTTPQGGGRGGLRPLLIPVRSLVRSNGAALPPR